MQGKFDSSHSRSTSLVRRGHLNGDLRVPFLAYFLTVRSTVALAPLSVHGLRGWFAVFAPGLQRVLSRLEHS